MYLWSKWRKDNFIKTFGFKQKYEGIKKKQYFDDFAYHHVWFKINLKNKKTHEREKQMVFILQLEFKVHYSN